MKPFEPSTAEARSADAGPQTRASALSSLFRELNRTLVRFINARLRNEQEANEIAQEAYVKRSSRFQRGSRSQAHDSVVSFIF